MNRTEFRIGIEFYTGSGKWRCTDIGTRCIAAIKLDKQDTSYYNGPPYAVVEHVFDEFGMQGCSLDPGEFSIQKSEGDEEPEQRRTGIHWDIRLQGRAWRADELPARYNLTPEKIELIEGILFWTDADRITMLGLLLENVGASAAVSLGDPAVWKEAIQFGR